MAKLPSHLAQYRQEALQAIANGLIKDTEFSGSTYQVLVRDPQTHRDCWVFLQLEGKGQIKDAFCSCEEEEEIGEVLPCIHLAMAYLSLFGHYSIPLHLRFERSLWNHLCRLYADRLGGDPSTLTELQAGQYIYKFSPEKTLFSIKAQTSKAIKRLENLLQHRPRQTEETSLKFSNLSHEEIVLWREGKPSPQLRYDLSYWSDLAKWLLSMQEEGKPYHLSFGYSNKQIPNWIQVDFDELKVGFYISEANLSEIIPSFTTVKSPLEVIEVGDQGIESIHYDKKEGRLHIKGKAISKSHHKIAELNVPSIDLDGWAYVPGHGFFAVEPHILLQTPVLEGAQLSQALTEHGRLISRFLKDAQIHFESIPISYQLFFDKNWNLHITSYLFEPGDLTHLIEDWAYVDEDGFYRIEGKRFEEIEKIIPIYEVSDFVTQNQFWFNAQEGFQTHVKSLEYQLTYTVSANGRLSFDRTLSKVKDASKIQDFGSWVYLDGHGFYPKKLSAFGFLLRPGLSLSAEQIPLFIKMNREELAFIPGFFSSVCPITKAGLDITLTDKQAIQITPEYERLLDYQNQPLRLFDYFVYVEGEGFYELPLELRLPEKFLHPVTLEGEERDFFLTYETQEIQKYIHYLDPYLLPPKEKKLVTSLVSQAEESGKGWYRFAFSYQTERGLISVIDIWDALRKKQTFAFFEAGLIDLRDKRYEWLQQLRRDRVNKESKTILLSSLEFMRLNAFDPVHLLDTESAGAPSSQELLDELTQLRTPEEPDISGLYSHLRPYQEIGVRWLWFLYHQHLSGLLCDDMGLGKTHQAMGLIASILNFYRSYAEGSSCHFLVVCPTSVMYHWQEKMHQFLPGVRVYTFHGTNRDLQEFAGQQYDVLLTSYGILRNERELISQIKFELAIFDEIQIAKNASSRIYATLRQIKAQMKLGLTGTPIENHLRELKSLFDIVLPSYMPGETDYREFFIRPIEKEHDSQRKKLLSRLIQPFVLRRRKEDVLTDLPEKTEEVSYCDLLGYQHQLYVEVLETRRRHLLEELQNQETAIPYLHIFALLSSLKQICDHPAVYLRKTEEYHNYPSGKWELFLELLREARESQQKVVVFSQYLGMLDIIEHYLTEQKIGFAALRGSTVNRKEQIKLFNQDPQCEVFVGSLQAAGLGVDLTAGSVVIHYDRWWNAARENQATDRVHRIGQTRGVQVFKLVTKNSFEEKIDAMILRKGKLMEDVVGIDEQNTLKKFSREELMDLLTLVETDEEHESISDIE